MNAEERMSEDMHRRAWMVEEKGTSNRSSAVL